MQKEEMEIQEKRKVFFNKNLFAASHLKTFF